MWCIGQEQTGTSGSCLLLISTLQTCKVLEDGLLTPKYVAGIAILILH
jgi:hypothetical protein